MIEFLIVTVLTACFNVFFLWTGLSWGALIPSGFFLVYCIGLLSSFSISSRTKDFLKNNTILLSWGLILSGVIILLIKQGLVRYHVIIITGILNIVLYYASYKRQYNDGKTLFLGGMIITTLMAICYARRTDHTDTIGIILAVSSVSILGILYSIPYLFDLSDKQMDTLLFQQELALYACIFVLLYHLFVPNYPAIIVSQLRFVSALIALRQSYLSTKDHVISKRKEGLSGRALLAGQKVLERYDTNTKSLSIDFFTALIRNGYMPSQLGTQILQYTQLVAISILVIISIIGVLRHTSYTLVWYRLGVICFVITIFSIPSQEKFIAYYKPIALGLITGAFYITLFDLSGDSTFFTRGSLTWLCINMIACLFHEELFPQTVQILTRRDILFWLSMIIIGSIITILSLIRLPLSGDIIFALSCIMIGLVSFFAYHIWKKEMR